MLKCAMIILVIKVQFAKYYAKCKVIPLSVKYHCRLNYTSLSEFMLNILLQSCIFKLYVITSDKGGGKCFCCLCSFVCLSVFLSVSKITQKQVHEMLPVDRCRDMEELINF